MSRRVTILVTVIAGVLALLAYTNVYLVRPSLNAGVLYWNSHEALILIESSTAGVRMSRLRYALEPLSSSLGQVRQPDRQRCTQMLVIRITDRNVDHYETDLYRHATVPYCGMATVPFRGQIYMGYLAKRRVWKWTGADFAEAPQEELEEFNPVESLSHGFQFEHVDGWSMRTFGQGTPKYPMTLNGQQLTLGFSGEGSPPRPLSLDLSRPGQQPETIWSMDGSPRRVNRVEYEEVFLLR